MASLQRKGEVLPNPDPSSITTESIDRAIHNLENRIDARFNGIEKATDAFHADLTRVPTLLDRSIAGLRELLETRIECMENDVEAVHDFLDKRGESISEQIDHLRDLMSAKIDLSNEKTTNLSEVADEKFNGIEKQFAERDKRTEQLSLADKTAIAAALQAQKEAAGAQNESNAAANVKMETNFSKLIDQGSALVMEIRRNTDVQLNDLKSRLDKGEGRSSVTDPTTLSALEKLTVVVGNLVAHASKTDGQGTGQREVIAWVIAGGAILMSLYLKR